MTSFFTAPQKHHFTHPPHILVIGAGSRGTTYAQWTLASTNAVIAGICEPIAHKRRVFAERFIPSRRVYADKFIAPEAAAAEHAWADWREWAAYERERRTREARGEEVPRGVDGVFVCVLDEMHAEVVCALAKMGVHVLVEKPLSTRLEGCVSIFNAVRDASGFEGVKRKEAVFGICHVLRYSAHNMLLRELVRGQEVIGDVLSVEHVEPVGWWHFSHSYVRGNWRKESKSAPSLLTKSCHDIDFILWLLCSPGPNAPTAAPHLPAYVSSTGSLKFFRKERKPLAAGKATNCLECPHEKECSYSSKKIYLDRLQQGQLGWPVCIVNPEMEDLYKTKGKEVASERFLKDLAEDYTPETPTSDIEARPWYGRCVWESDNDVVDDQCVTITWEDDPVEHDMEGRPVLHGRGAKTAQFHMVAFTEKICQRRGRIYGTKGEIEYDSATITVHDFTTGSRTVHQPHLAAGESHGGGDIGLVRQFLMAVAAVDTEEMSAAEAQRTFLGCDIEEAFRSHAMVFAAEDARTTRQVVDWQKWWSEQVEARFI